jgi:hypothetical protein
VPVTVLRELSARELALVEKGLEMFGGGGSEAGSSAKSSNKWSKICATLLPAWPRKLLAKAVTKHLQQQSRRAQLVQAQATVHILHQQQQQQLFSASMPITLPTTNQHTVATPASATASVMLTPQSAMSTHALSTVATASLAPMRLPFELHATIGQQQVQAPASVTPRPANATTPLALAKRSNEVTSATLTAPVAAHSEFDEVDLEGEDE